MPVKWKEPEFFPEEKDAYQVVYTNRNQLRQSRTADAHLNGKPVTQREHHQ